MAQYTPKRMMVKSTTSKAVTAKKNATTKSSPLSKVSVDKKDSVAIRQIENGYIVSESGYSGKGKNQRWENKEYFSPTNPIKFGSKK